MKRDRIVGKGQIDVVQRPHLAVIEIQALNLDLWAAEILRRLGGYDQRRAAFSNAWAVVDGIIARILVPPAASASITRAEMLRINMVDGDISAPAQARSCPILVRAQRQTGKMTTGRFAIGHQLRLQN